MKVFLDTNVLVSAFAARGLCSDLYQSLLGRHELLTGRNVLRELDTALREKLMISAEGCRERVESISNEASRIVEVPEPVDCEADADDLLVLGEAVAGGAEVFVTGDAGLIALKIVRQTRILSPREFWETLGSEKRE